MLEAALINECADPSLKPAIVEQFVKAAGSPDPLAITVKSGSRLILVPKAETAEEAMEIVRQNVGRYVVRVGLTQFPAGVGVKDVSELKPDLVEPCANLRIGTARFARILRIVARWYGNSMMDRAFPEIFEDAIHAWKSGVFEGERVFLAEDPAGETAQPEGPTTEPDAGEISAETDPIGPAGRGEKAANAGMRIDLNRIGGQK